ncbi:PAS domain S-box-containing protein [Aquiflexum balticum DSM 16537]|uniref:histidine kinase n=1 Tax=Aquiflexum balticum DSM 16537 TaxID=758820 RepID=A0A1W2H3A6_9BACT|nr:PAS domain S-box-containing protein [Aquiflexum balticum DSM 16537]
MQKKALLYLFLLASHFGLAQNFLFNNQIKGVELPTDMISEVIQDEKGLVWFNTSLGIFYSDGFFTYPVPDSIQSQLSSSAAMFQDEMNQIWVYNQTNIPKVYFFSGAKWHEVEIPESILKGMELNYFRFSKNRILEGEVLFFINEKNIVFGSSESGTWSNYPYTYGELGEFSASYNWGESVLLFFRNGSLQYKNGVLSSFYFEGIELPSPVQHLVYEETANSYYYLGDDFLAVGKNILEPDKVVAKGFVRDIFSLANYSNLQVFEGDVYFNFNSQLYKYNPETGLVLEIDAYESLKAYHINSFLVDREGIIWISSDRGLVNINSLRFLNYDSKFLMDDEVSAILKLDGQSYLLGFNNGLQYWQKDKLRTLLGDTKIIGHPKFRITNFDQDKNGIVWFSSNLNGMGRINPKTMELEFQPSPDLKFVSAVKSIGDSLFIVTRDRIYLSTIYSRKGQHFQNEIMDTFLKELNQSVAYVRKVDKLQDGRMIIMQGGNLPEDQNFVATDQVFSTVGYDFLEDGDCLILGTEKGLKKYCNGIFDFYMVNNEKIDRPVYAILKDSQGYLWAGTDLGLYRIGEEDIINFNEKNGLIGSEVNRGALLEGDAGEILIGTSKGLSVFFPGENKEYQNYPLTDIIKVEVLGFKEGEVDLERIPFGNNNIQITFQAVSFLQSNDLVVRYLLEGFHEDWIELVNPRTNVLTFNNLPAGEYKLKLQAGFDGVYGEREVNSDSFRILRPIYLQFWFVITLLLVFLLIGFLLNSLLNSFRKQGVLKKAVDEKSKQVINIEDQFKNVWQSSKDGLMLSDDKGKVLAINPSLEKMAEITSEEIEKRWVHELFAEPEFYFKTSPSIIKSINNPDSNGEVFELDIPFRSGSKQIELYVVKLKSEFEGVKLNLSVFRDITVKKAYEVGLEKAKEKAEEANRLKSNFLSNISHEIRTPLNGILGITENILIQKNKDDGLVSQLEIIQESGERLLSTINSILDLSKLEAKKMEVVYKETNINDLLAKILLPLKEMAVRKGLLLSTKYETQPLIGLIDGRYFEMILNNLVGNAIKYSNEGMISVKLRGNSDQIELEVKDQGIGMSEDFQKILFSPFEQESSGYGRSFEGTGLGLTITKNLVDILGGEIFIKSVKNQGTKVKVILPLGKK